MSAPVVNIEDLIDRQDVRRTLPWILFWAAAAMLADGYDLLSIAYVGPTILKEWGLDKHAFATVLSISAGASMLGGFASGYIADRFGRRLSIIAGTLLLGLSTLGSTLATNLDELLFWRAVAGFGIGTVPPVAIALANEFAPQRLRASVIAALYLGTTIGAWCAAQVRDLLVPTHGWQIMFVIGGIAPLVVCAGLVLFLPESPRFLALRRPGSVQLLRLARRLAPASVFAPETQFVAAREPALRGDPLPQLFLAGRWRLTLTFWLAYFASGMTLYTMIYWSPIILESLGVDAGRAAVISAWAGLTGWLGGLVVTRLIDRYGLRAMIVPPLIGIPLVAGLGYLGGAPAAIIVAITLLGGMAFSGGHSGLHATGALIYPTAIRANGVGLGLFVTRSAGVVAPLITAVLYTGNSGVQHVLWAAAIPLAVVSACYVALSRLHREIRA